MLTVLPALVMAPLLVGGSTLACRRWGPSIGGLLSALPAIVGPVLLITAQLRGAEFAARAANGTLLGLAGLSAFAVAYGWAARRAGWGVSLAAGWLGAAAVTLMFGRLAGGLGFPTGLVIAVVSLTAGYIAMPRSFAAPSASTETVSPSRPGAEVPLRMVVTAALVAILAAATAALGPLVGGMLAALPTLASVLAAFTHRRDGSAAVVALLRGMLSGLAGFVGFCAVVAVLIVPAGTATAFALAAVTAVALQAGLLAGERGRGRTAVTADTGTA